MDLQVSRLQRAKPGGKFTKANKSKLKKSLDIVKQQQMLKTFYTNNALRNKAAMDWPLSNRSSDVAPITINFKIIVIMSRIFGCHPHPLWSSGKKIGTAKLAKFYSMMWALVVTILIVSQIRDMLLCQSRPEVDNLCIPKIAYVIVILVVHLLSAVFSVVRAGNFETAIARLQNFDEATCLKKKGGTLANIVAAGLLIFSWCMILWITPLSMLFIEPTVIVCMLGTLVLSVEIYRYCFVLIAVRDRFVRLKNLVSSGGIDVGATEGVYYQPLTVQNVFTLHYWLSDAAANFNKYFSIQIVYWLVYTIANMIVNAFLIAIAVLEMNLKSDQLLTLIYIVYNATLICAASHFTCKRANELGKLLFGYRAPKLETTVSSMEVLEFGFYLYMKPLRITGSGMFVVDLPLLLAVFEASATYMTLVVVNGPSFYKAIALNSSSVNSNES